MSPNDWNHECADGTWDFPTDAKEVAHDAVLAVARGPRVSCQPDQGQSAEMIGGVWVRGEEAQP